MTNVTSEIYGFHIKILYERIGRELSIKLNDKVYYTVSTKLKNRLSELLTTKLSNEIDKQLNTIWKI